jgi:hypothetical protein
LTSPANILTINATATITRINDINGSHLNEICVVLPITLATDADSFNAAARPIMIAKKENRATIIPLLIPLKMASTIKTAKTISIII